MICYSWVKRVFKPIGIVRTIRPPLHGLYES